MFKSVNLVSISVMIMWGVSVSKVIAFSEIFFVAYREYHSDRLPQWLTVFPPQNKLNKEFLSVSHVLITYHKVCKIEINLDEAKDFYKQETLNSFNSGQLRH